MNSISIAEHLEVGKEYKVKFTWSKRFSRYVYQGVSNVSGEDVMQFKSNSDTKFVFDEHITELKDSEPLKPKAKEGKTCPRCLGNKVYAKFAHVNGGRCFKCDGQGII